MSSAGTVRHHSTDNNFNHDSSIESVLNPYQNTVLSKEVNGKMKMARKVTGFEIDRVEKHKKIREK